MLQPQVNQNARASPHFGWNEQLYDGTPVQVRPLTKKDAALELEFLNQLTPELRRLRFLGLIREPTPEVAEELTNLDANKALGFAAIIADDDGERQIGAAHFHTNTNGDTCDCSVTVHKYWQKRGVGSILMRRLIDAAKARGIRRMLAQAPSYSDGSQHLAMRLGFQRCPDPRDPATVVYKLRLR